MPKKLDLAEELRSWASQAMITNEAKELINKACDELDASEARVEILYNQITYMELENRSFP